MTKLDILQKVINMTVKLYIYIFSEGRLEYDQWWINFTNYVNEEFTKLRNGNASSFSHIHNEYEALLLSRTKILRTYGGFETQSSYIAFKNKKKAAFFVLRFS